MYQEMGMDITHQTEVRLHLKTCNASFVNTGIVDSLRLAAKIGQPTGCPEPDYMRAQCHFY